MPLRNKKILITAGPTRAPLDAVRFITNKGTGATGARIAEEAISRGARVTYVYGRPSQIPVVRGPVHDHLRLIAIETVDDVIRVFKSEIPRGYDAVIQNMSVLDFQPDVVRTEKTASAVEEWTIRLVPTPKVIGLVKDLAPETFLVGFKLEVGKEPEELRRIALQFLKKNRCDLVVANDLRQIEGGEHTGYFVTPDGRVAKVAVGKDAIARSLIDYLDAHLE